MLTRTLRDKWAAALESGRYEQTSQCLWDDQGHCCLGVLVDQYAPECWLPSVRPGAKQQVQYAGELNDSELPETLRKAIGMTLVDMDRFMSLNDHHGWSFEEIAQEVRKLPVRSRKR
jgi:hypothetical protein